MGHRLQHSLTCRAESGLVAASLGRILSKLKTPNHERELGHRPLAGDQFVTEEMCI